MSSGAKRVREQSVVYLAERDRELLDELARESGLPRTELFRRGLWALAAQMRGTSSTSAFDVLIAGAGEFNGPPDYSERSDDYVYGGAPLLNRVAESPESSSPAAADTSATPKKSGKRARRR